MEASERIALLEERLLRLEKRLSRDFLLRNQGGAQRYLTDQDVLGTISGASGNLLISNLVTSDNSPAVGSISWGPFDLWHKGVLYQFQEGDTSEKFVFWDDGDATLTKSSSFVHENDRFLLLINDSGKAREVWRGSEAARSPGSYRVLTNSIWNNVESGVWTYCTLSLAALPPWYPRGYDVGGFFNWLVPTQLVVPTGGEGLYFGTQNIYFGSTAAGIYRKSKVEVIHNGVTSEYHEQPITPANVIHTRRPLMFYLYEGDVIKSAVMHDAGVNIIAGTGIHLVKVF